MPPVRRRPAGIWIAAAILVLAGCVGRNETSRPPATATPSPAPSPRSPSVQLFAALPPGWSLSLGPTVTEAAELERAVDRDAPYFRDFGVVDVTTATLDAGGPPISVELFRFPDPAHAFGAWARRRNHGVARTVQIGDAAYLGRSALHVWKGTYYARLFGPAADESGLEQAAGSILAGVAAAEGLPPEFDMLSAASRVPSSESIRVHGGFGQPYLAGAFEARYRRNGIDFEGLAFRARDARSAAEALDDYRTLYGVNGKLFDPIPGLGEESFSGEDRLLGRTVAFRRGRWLVAYRGFCDIAPLVAASRDSDSAIRNHPSAN